VSIVDAFTMAMICDSYLLVLQYYYDALWNVDKEKLCQTIMYGWHQ